ncbi:hypothetical protein [Methylobacterium durans]|nr:hypothetical protein [Methylobacterium durans]
MGIALLDCGEVQQRMAAQVGAAPMPMSDRIDAHSALAIASGG